MMYGYEKRWWYLFFSIVFVCVASYFFDFKSQWQQLAQFNIARENQLVELTRLKAQKSLQPKRLIKNNHEKLHPFLLETLMPLLQINHLALRAMNDQGTQINNGVAMDAVRLTVEGRFVDVERLLIVMTQLHASVVVNFSFKAISSANTLFTLDLLLWQGVNLPFTEKEKAFTISHENPMCFKKEDLIVENADVLLQRIMVTQIKMIGYIAGEKGAKALVLLPNGSIAEVESGMVIGKEHATVTHIDEEAISLLHQGRNILLTRAESYMHEEENE